VALKRAALSIAIAAAAVTLAATSATPPHHTGDGHFRNNYTGPIDKSLGELLRWRRQAWAQGLPPDAKVPTPVVAPQLDHLKAGHAPSATWIGHATVLMQSGGLNVLTDPVFSERASPVGFLGPKRAQPPGIALDDLPPIDVVLVSHNHYDHCDVDSLRRLSERSTHRTLFLVPLGLKALLEKHGARNVVELDWWQSHTVAGTDFHLVPVQHWSARGLGDRNETLWGGWAVFAPDLRWYFSGDTGFTRDFADTRARLKRYERDGGLFDLALLAIGAYEPRWFMIEQHMNPREAVQAHRDLGARRSLGIHWGTFPLTDEALDQPPRDLDAARRAAGVAEADFFTLAIGETRWLAAQSKP
jgi:N-acyl-phosphatidylethanolamine-hydrolysing phospholipase D